MEDDRRSANNTPSLPFKHCTVDAVMYRYRSEWFIDVEGPGDGGGGRGTRQSCSFAVISESWRASLAELATVKLTRKVSFFRRNPHTIIAIIILIIINDNNDNIRSVWVIYYMHVD